MARALKMAGTIALVTQIASISAAHAQKSSEFVGRWKGESVGGGTRTTVIIEFFPRGTYSRRVEVSSEFGWTQNGDALMLAPALGRNDNDVSYGKPSVLRMKLANDVLSISDSLQTISLKRVTVPINESAILGRWEGQSDLNEGITQDFLSDGRLIITITLTREAGRFAVDGSNLVFEEQIPVPQKKKTRFRMEDGKLVMYATPDVPALELVRVADGSQR